MTFPPDVFSPGVASRIFDTIRDRMKAEAASRNGWRFKELVREEHRFCWYFGPDKCDDSIAQAIADVSGPILKAIFEAEGFGYDYRLHPPHQGQRPPGVRPQDYYMGHNLIHH